MRPTPRDRIGEGRHFIGALLVPNFAELRRWAQHKHLSFASDAELVALPEVRAKMQRRVDRVNAGFSNYEQIDRTSTGQGRTDWALWGR